MLKKSPSVFGRIDYFSVLPYLIVSLRASLELDWMLLLPEISMFFSGFLKVIDASKEVISSKHPYVLGNQNVPARVDRINSSMSETLKNWTRVAGYLLQYAATQQMDSVHKQISRQQFLLFGLDHGFLIL